MNRAVIAAAGFFAGVVATLLVLALWVTYFSKPQPTAMIQAPSNVENGETFEIKLILENPHDSALTVDSVDVPLSALENLELVAVIPDSATSSDYPELNLRSWEVAVELNSGNTFQMRFLASTRSPWRFQVPFDVCNSNLDCSTIFAGFEAR